MSVYLDDGDVVLPTCPECGEPIDEGEATTTAPRWHGDTPVHAECA